MKKTNTVLTILALLCLGLLFGCRTNGHDDEQTAPAASETVMETETPDGENALTLVADGESRYVIVRTDLDVAEGKLAVTLRNAIRDATGVTLPIRTDFSSEDISAFEIVVGKTMRENETVLTDVPVRTKDWVIERVENRIFLRGGDYEGTKAAVEKFTEHYIHAGTGTVDVPDTLFLKGGGPYRIENITVNGNPLDRYTVVISRNADKSTVYAAEEWQRYMEAATGCRLPIVKDSAKETDFEILIGLTNRDKNAVDLTGLGDEGFIVSSLGDKILITGGENSLHGTLYGVYEFLSTCVGYRFYASDAEIPPEADSIEWRNISLRWAPVIDYRQVLWGNVIFDSNLSAKYRISGDWGIGSNQAVYPLRDRYIGNSAHTFAELMDVPQNEQPCLCDETNYEKALARVMEKLKSGESGQLISVSQNDNRNYCKCDKCRAKEAELGTKADILLSFVNRIAAEVAKEYPDVMIHTFAYMFTIEPPKTVKPADNVLIEFAPIDCCRYCALDDPDCAVNARYLNDLKGWAALTDHLQIWDYTTDFGAYLMPFPDFYALRRNAAVYAQYGIDGVFSQGQQNGGKAGFGVMSSYLVSRLLAEPTMSEEAYEAEIVGFMKGYYGPAWEPVYSYFKAIHEINKGYHFGAANSAGYLERLAELDALWEAAKKLVEGDPVLLLHVQLAELQHTYAKLCLTWEERYLRGDADSKKRYQAENEAFYQILKENDITLDEGTPIGEAKVDYQLPPNRWH